MCSARRRQLWIVTRAQTGWSVHFAAAIADNAVKLETARAEAVKARAEAAHAELEKAEEELKRLEKVEKELEGTMSMSKIEQSLSEQQRSQVNWRDLGPLSV